MGAGDAGLNCCGFKDMTYLKTLHDKNQDPLQPSYGRSQADTQGSAIMRFHEFLWIIMWAHLSEETLENFRDLFSGASRNHPHYPQEKACLTRHVERTVTCIVQVVACVVYSSTAIWKSAMNSAGNGFVNPSWKHARPALEPQLFLVATKDALTFVMDLGFNPVYPERLRWENSRGIRSLDAQVGGTSRITDAMGTDLMLCQAIVFVAQMKHLTDTCERLRQDARGRASVMKEILKHTLQKNFPIDDSAVVGLAAFMDPPHTIGFDLRPTLALIEFTEPLQLEAGGFVDPCTHLISRFMPVQDGDWEDSDVAMGPFFDISHVTRLFSKTTQTNSARSGGDENDNGADASAHADPNPPDEEAPAGSGAPADAHVEAEDEDEDEEDADDDAGEKKKRERKGDQEEQGRKEKKRKTKERAKAGEACLAKAREVLQPILSLADETDDETDVNDKFNRFQEELAELTRDDRMNLYKVLQRLRNGDGDGESEEQVSGHGSPRCAFIEYDAECGDGSADENINEHKYNTPGDKHFIDPNENQQANTDALHRQLDNEHDRNYYRKEDSVSISTFSFQETVCLDDVDKAIFQHEEALFCQSGDQEEEGLNPRIGSGFEM